MFTTLAFAGVTSFVAAALLSAIGIGSIPVFGNVNDIVASYGLSIICFLAGTHRWRLTRKPQETTVLLQKHGLRVTDSAGIVTNPLTRRIGLKASLMVNYMLAPERHESS